MAANSDNAPQAFKIIQQYPSTAELRIDAVCLDHARAIPAPEHQVPYTIVPPDAAIHDLKVAVSRLKQHHGFQRLMPAEQHGMLQNLVWLLNDRYLAKKFARTDMLRYALQETSFPEIEFARSHVFSVGRHTFSDDALSEGFCFPADMYHVRNFLPVGGMALLVSELGVVGVAHTTETARTLTILDYTQDDKATRASFSVLEACMEKVASIQINSHSQEAYDAQYPKARDKALQAYTTYCSKAGPQLATILQPQEVKDVWNLWLLNSTLRIRWQKRLAKLYHEYDGDLKAMQTKYPKEATYLAPAQILRQIPTSIGAFPPFVIVKESEVFSHVPWKIVYDILSFANVEGFIGNVQFAVVTTRSNQRR